MIGALTPIAATYNIWCLFALRFCQELFLGVTFDCINQLTAGWSPEQLHSRFISFAYMGGTVGTVVSYSTGGLILASTNWDYIFYATSGAAAFWCAAWFLLFHDSPEEHSRLTEKEKKMIVSSRSNNPMTRVKELKTSMIPLL